MGKKKSQLTVKQLIGLSKSEPVRILDPIVPENQCIKASFVALIARFFIIHRTSKLD